MKSMECRYVAYIGTYTGSGSKGIYRYAMDKASGRLDYLGTAGELDNPSYLVSSPDGSFLYAVSETERHEGTCGGAAGAYSIDNGTGELRFLGSEPTYGRSPCHLCVDSRNRFLFTANYSDGSVSMFRLDTDGKIGALTGTFRHEGSGPNRERQERPHAHFVALTPDEKYLCAVDLGIDKLMLYSIELERETLVPATPPCISITAGYGPRHLVFGRDGRHVYIVNELGSAITVMEYAPCGPSFTEIQSISTLPADFTGCSICAAIRLSPDGSFLYASNRGHDSLAIYRIDPQSGELSLLSIVPTQGKHPRDFAIDPTGRYLYVANMHTDTLVPFAISPESGLLEPLDCIVGIPSPTCITFVAFAHCTDADETG